MLRTTCLGALGALALASSAGAQDRFATSIVAYTQGSGSGIFVTANALGGPQGGGLGQGSVDVLSLGSGGQVTLAFDVVLTDGPGADFTVFENPFAFGTGIFAEYATVEVSSNGTDFAAFPHDPPAPAATWGSAPGLAGGTPCISNVVSNAVDPFDPVVSGGDAFDLAELADDPSVAAGLVDLAAIRFVRLADVSGADIDAVAVIQHQDNQAAGAPTCDLWRDESDRLHLRLADPDGLADLDLSTLRVSVNLVQLQPARLLAFMVPLTKTATELELVTTAPLSAVGPQAVLAVSVADQAGHFSGDQLSVAP